MLLGKFFRATRRLDTAAANCRWCCDGSGFTSLTGSILSCCFAFVMVRCECVGVLSYFVTDKEKQSAFTGHQQRHGVWILAFLVDGLFDRGRQRAARGTTATAGTCDEAERAARRLLRSLCSIDGALDEDQGGAADAVDDLDVDEEDRAAAKAVTTFDWDAYRRAYADTPLHAAVTTMFAEYALLVGSLTRRLGPAAITPMTLTEGAALAEQAQKFILQYASPILGTLGTTKVHRLLCHVLHAVSYHGNILNANTSANESKHKEDKKHYSRTNKRRGYTRQLVRRAQGTRAVLKRNAELHVDGRTEGRRRRERTVVNGYAADVDESNRLPRRVRTQHLAQHYVRRLAEEPGLSTLATLLGTDGDKRVGVLSFTHILARLPHGSVTRQVVHASSLFHGASWFDHVEYRQPDAPADGAVHYGQARLLLRLLDGTDVAIVAAMEQPSAADEGPLTARGCVQLCWTMEDDSDPGNAPVRIRIVALADVVRVVHVVPDCARLCRQRGLGTSPPPFGSTGEIVRDMRYYLNAFLPDEAQ